ncbi:LysR family transcriptional regulator [Vibrio marisflavi]|nr:LysR family transcriptional regulator [Vibrio marisflavi]
MNINGSAIKNFLNIYEFRSITEAAKISGLAQSNVTKQLQSLESKLDTVLFDRHTRNLVPTKAADYLYSKFDDLYREFALLESMTKKVNDGFYGNLNIGIGKIISPLISQVLCLNIQNNEEEYKELKVTISSDTFMNLNKKLLQGEIDLFISQSEIQPNIPELDLLVKSPFLSLETACIIGPSMGIKEDVTDYKWAFPQFDTNHIVSRLNNPILRDFYLKAAAKGNIAYQVDSGDARVQLAESGQAGTIVPFYMVEEKIKAGKLIRLSKSMDYFDFSIYYLANRPINNNVRKIINDLKVNLIKNYHFIENTTRE